VCQRRIETVGVPQQAPQRRELTLQHVFLVPWAIAATPQNFLLRQNLFEQSNNGRLKDPEFLSLKHPYV
jgi:hypothetical protein